MTVKNKFVKHCKFNTILYCHLSSCFTRFAHSPIRLKGILLIVLQAYSIGLIERDLRYVCLRLNFNTHSLPSSLNFAGPGYPTAPPAAPAYPTAGNMVIN